MKEHIAEIIEAYDNLPHVGELKDFRARYVASNFSDQVLDDEIEAAVGAYGQFSVLVAAMSSLLPEEYMERIDARRARIERCCRTTTYAAVTSTAIELFREKEFTDRLLQAEREKNRIQDDRHAERDRADRRTDESVKRLREQNDLLRERQGLTPQHAPSPSMCRDDNERSLPPEQLAEARKKWADLCDDADLVEVFIYAFNHAESPEKLRDNTIIPLRTDPRTTFGSLSVRKQCTLVRLCRKSLKDFGDSTLQRALGA